MSVVKAKYHALFSLKSQAYNKILKPHSTHELQQSRTLFGRFIKNLFTISIENWGSIFKKRTWRGLYHPYLCNEFIPTRPTYAGRMTCETERHFCFGYCTMCLMLQVEIQNDDINCNYSVDNKL